MLNLQRWIHRHRQVHFHKGLLQGLLAGLIFAGIMWWWWGLAALVILVPAAAGGSLLGVRRSRPQQAVAELDRRLDFDQQLVTAYEYRQDVSNPFVQRLAANVAVMLKDRNPENVFPRRWLPEAVLIVLAAAALGTGHFVLDSSRPGLDWAFPGETVMAPEAWLPDAADNGDGSGSGLLPTGDENGLSTDPAARDGDRDPLELSGEEESQQVADDDRDAALDRARRAPEEQLLAVETESFAADLDSFSGEVLWNPEDGVDGLDPDPDDLMVDDDGDLEEGAALVFPGESGDGSGDGEEQDESGEEGTRAGGPDDEIDDDFAAGDQDLEAGDVPQGDDYLPADETGDQGVGFGGGTDLDNFFSEASQRWADYYSAQLDTAAQEGQWFQFLWDTLGPLDPDMAPGTGEERDIWFRQELQNILTSEGIPLYRRQWIQEYFSLLTGNY